MRSKHETGTHTARGDVVKKIRQPLHRQSGVVHDGGNNHIIQIRAVLLPDLVLLIDGLVVALCCLGELVGVNSAKHVGLNLLVEVVSQRGGAGGFRGAHESVMAVV